MTDSSHQYTMCRLKKRCRRYTNFRFSYSLRRQQMRPSRNLRCKRHKKLAASCKQSNLQCRNLLRIQWHLLINSRKSKKCRQLNYCRWHIALRLMSKLSNYLLRLNNNLCYRIGRYLNYYTPHTRLRLRCKLSNYLLTPNNNQYCT